MNYEKPTHVFSRVERLKEHIPRLGSITLQDSVRVNEKDYPIYSIHLGASGKNVPTLVFVGGVHGLEIIGAEVVVSYLETLCTLSEWDRTIHDQLQNIKLVIYPFVNPGGIVLNTRSNPNGVDLMRNAPIEAESLSPYFLPGGHRISPKLPWYRGPLNAPMEKEAQTLFRVMKEEVWDSPFSLIVDFHSGFGMKDRVWFPYANTTEPFPRISEVYKLKTLFDRTYPYNIYSFEPQATQYRTHGDFWDYLFKHHQNERPQNIMLPLCLELGSWIWIKKNPRQIFNTFGIFNPIVPHRQQRTLRRHIYLLDFLVRATVSAHKWIHLEDKERTTLNSRAMKLWY